MLSLVPTFFLVFSVYFIRQRSVQCAAKIYREVAMGQVHPVRSDVEQFSTFTIPQVEEADLRLCQIRTELVCGVVPRQTVSS